MLITLNVHVSFFLYILLFLYEVNRKALFYVKITSSISYMLRICLFSLSFCICGVKNAVRYLVIHQTMFYTMGSIKKLSLKRSFCKAVFT